MAPVPHSCTHRRAGTTHNHNLRGVRAEGIDGMTVNIAGDAPVTAFELRRLTRRPRISAGQQVGNTTHLHRAKTGEPPTA